ncbi:putative cytochrome P450 6d4 [Halotydeus destructor]|nr:putative cytochrome P450 6d4 [Halotydeus destructor]
MILAVFAFLVLVSLWSIYRKLTLWSRYGVPTNYQYFLGGFTTASGLLDVATIRETGKVVGVYAGLEPVLLVGDVDLAKRVLSTQFDDFVNHTPFQQENAPMGQSVFTLKDNRWRETRKIITPTFTSSKLRSMQSLIDESCLDLIEQLDFNKGKAVDIKNIICGFTMDVIASTAFGTKVNTAKNPQNEIAVNGRRHRDSNMILAIFAILVSISLWVIYRKLTIWSRCGVPTNYGHFLRGFKMASGLVDVQTIKETGKVVGVYNGLEPALLIGDVEMAKKSQSNFSLRQVNKLDINMYLDTVLSVISVLPLVGASLALIIAFYNWCVTKSLSCEGVSTGPRVSVLVPARNEEEYLADCLLSLADQEYDNYEILVMDDASTDKTYEIAQTLSKTYTRITVHQSTKLPEGWFGKSHAVDRLIKKATGDLILMTDADAVHRPNSIGFAVKNMADYDCDFLSGWGRQECASLSAKLLLPIGWIMAAFNPYSSKALPLKSTFAFAVGSYICCKRQALDDIGGMFKVRQSICEDYALANNFRLSGYKTAFVPIVNVMTIGDKYEYNKKIFLRYSRVAAAAMQENFLPSLFILLPLIISVYIVPSISVIGSILTGADFNMQNVYIQVIILLTYVFYVQIYGGAQNMLLYPFQACYLVGAVLHAMGCRIYGLGTEWKKRKLHVD